MVIHVTEKDDHCLCVFYSLETDSTVSWSFKFKKGVEGPFILIGYLSDCHLSAYAQYIHRKCVY